MAQNNLERQLVAGIRAAQSGNKERARELLEAVLRTDRNSELAWIWLASVVDNTRERRICLQKVLQVNPANRPAQEAVNNLVGILGDTAVIDYGAISRAAKTQIGAGGDSLAEARAAVTGSPNPRRAPAGATTAQRGGGGMSRGMMLVLLGIVALVLVILLLTTLAPTLNPEPTATATETSIPATRIPSTLQPTPLGGGFEGAVLTREAPEALPTNTPLPTSTATTTPIPTATLPPLVSYEILFTARGSTGQPALYRMNLGQGSPNRLTGDVRGIAYSEQLGRVTFLRNAGGDDGTFTTQVFIAGINNVPQPEIITRMNTGAANSAALSPDGLRIVFSSSQDGDDDLYIYDTRTGVTTNIINNSDISDIDPVWSPDGTTIYFASNRDELSFYDIYALTVANNEAVRLFDERGSNVKPQISPDGQRLLYLNLIREDSEIFIYDFGTNRSRQISQRGQAVEDSPTWTLDGRYVLFVARVGEVGAEIGQVGVMDSEGNNRQVFAFEGLDVLDLRAIRSGN